MVIMALNYEYLGNQSGETWVTATPLRTAQLKAYANIKEAINYIVTFVGHTAQKQKFPVWAEEIKKKRLDYTGSAVTRALPLPLAELRPGMPKPEVAASVRAVDIASPEVKAWRCDPSQGLTPA